MSTLFFLLPIVLLLSLWLGLRARAGSMKRKETAEFTAKMLAQLEQMEADFNASERKYAEIQREQREQRKLDKAQRISENRMPRASTPRKQKHKPKLENSSAVKWVDSSSPVGLKTAKKNVVHSPPDDFLSSCYDRRDQGRIIAAFLETWRARMSRLRAILLGSFGYLARNCFAFVSRRPSPPPHQLALPQSRAT